LALHIARYANRLADKVTIYTNGNDKVTEEVKKALAACKPESKTRKNISIEQRKIVKFVKLENGADVEVVLEDGDKRTEGFLAHKPKEKLNGPWVEQLGLEVTESGNIKVTEPFRETSVAGVFAGGDNSSPMKAATLATCSGALLAAGVAAQLEAED
jgi:thioredoxin reductase